MAIKTLYTAVGRFERRTNGCNRSCPIILLGGQEYMVDMQEMVIWSMLNWRILRWDDIAQEYEKLSTASGYCTERSWEDCTNRLLTRGLLVSGSGETEYDALYDLLEESEDCVRFETQNSHYHLSMSPFPLAAVSPLPVRLAACA